MHREGSGLLREFADLIGNLIVLNVLFLICSIPIVTIGASLCGLYRSLLHMIRGEGHTVNEFFAGFRSDFGKSSAVWILLAVPALAMWGNYVFFSVSETANTAVIILICLVSFWILAVGNYAFALISQFSNSFGVTLRNALLLSVTNLPKTFLLIALSIAFPLLAIFKTDIFLRLLIVWLACGVSLPLYFSSLLLNRIFQPFLKHPASDEEPTEE